jgi:hypothetical protein
MYWAAEHRPIVYAAVVSLAPSSAEDLRPITEAHKQQGEATVQEKNNMANT